MKNILKEVLFISSQINKDCIIYKNPVDDSVNVFVFVEINHKTANTPYHELIGIDITDDVSRLNEQTFNATLFENQLEKKMHVNIRSAENNWIWVRAINPI